MTLDSVQILVFGRFQVVAASCRQSGGINPPLLQTDQPHTAWDSIPKSADYAQMLSQGYSKRFLEQWRAFIGRQLAGRSSGSQFTDADPEKAEMATSTPGAISN